MAKLDLEQLAAAGTNVSRMGEAHALARYSDLETSSAEVAFRRGYADGAAAALAQLQGTLLGLMSFDDYLERMCDPDSVPGSAAGATPSPFMPPSGPAPESVFEQSLYHQARAYAPRAAGATPIDAYVVGFKGGAANALYNAQRVTASLYEFHAELSAQAYRSAVPASAGEPSASQE